MNIFSTLLLTALLCVLTSSARADVDIRISVKFILSPTGAAPVTVPGDGNFDLSSSGAFDVEIAHGNRVLADTGRGQRLRVIEYLTVMPPVPDGQPADYWYNLDARANRRTIENAATASTGPWKWNGAGALNIYVNNSGSGQCSFIGSGVSISLGSTIYSRGTVVHEIGHFFDLSHTQGADAANPGNECFFGDGDGLSETLPDNGCFTTMDQLSQANFGMNYNVLNAAQKLALDNTWFNVMSYHQEERLLGIQMDYWATNANEARHSVCGGYTWFVAPDGFDVFRTGLSPGQSFRTMEWGLAHISSPNDVVLMRSGTYSTPAEITTPCTLSAAYGPVTLSRP